MAMIKIVSPSGWDFDGPIMTPIKISSRGLIGNDRSDFIKRASHTFLPFLDEIKFAADEEPVHAIALGASEAWGVNRNGDGFKEATCKRYHNTFEKFARAFRNHKNKNPAESYGVIKKSAYHDTMRRVELLLGYNKTKEAAERNGGFVADKEIEKLARGEDLAVSMACLTDPDYPILTKDRGYVRIVDIQVGDLVHTHAGRWRKVKQLNRRSYTGEVLTFSVNGLPFPLEVTADHPMWAKTFGLVETRAIQHQARRYFKDPETFASQAATWTLASDIGIGDRFFYRPINRYEGYGRIADVDLATVMGYYLAEGSFGFNGDRASMVMFTCNMSDSLPRRLPLIVERMFPDITINIRPHPNSPVGLVVELFSTEFAEFLRRYIGRGCRNKFIPPEIFNAEEHIKLAFLGAWLDGDGFTDKKGVHWSTASSNLVLQGRDLLASIGVPASIYMIDHAKCATSGYAGSGKEYTLNIGHLESWRLAEYSQKIAHYIAPVNKRTKPATMRLCEDGTYALRIKNIERRFVTDTITYNFEVEEDESYSAAGLISHNCRIDHDVCSWCGNKARTRDDYCTPSMCKAGGCKENLTKLIKIGGDVHQLGVDNPHPTWFDLSMVFRPADRIAYGGKADYFTKAASDNGFFGVGGAKMAEDLGVMAPLAVNLQQESLPGEFSSALSEQIKLAHGLDMLDKRQHALALPADFRRAFSSQIQSPFPLDRLGDAGTVKAAAVLGALADVKIILPLRDFARWTKRANLNESAASQLIGVYGRMIEDGSLERRLAQSPHVPAAKLASAADRRWASGLRYDYSLDKDIVRDRCLLSSVRGQETPSVKSALETTKQAADNKESEELARDYATYKVACLQRIAETDGNFLLTCNMGVVQNLVI